MTERLRFILLTISHFFLTFATLLAGLAITMAAFDGEGSGHGGGALLVAHRVLSFPIGSIGGRWLAGLGVGGFPAEHFFFLLNSILWTKVGLTLWSLAPLRRRTGQLTGGEEV